MDYMSERQDPQLKYATNIYSKANLTACNDVKCNSGITFIRQARGQKKDEKSNFMNL